MKKLLLPTILFCAAAAQAQTPAPTTMQVQLKSGQTVEYTIADIDKITFAGNDTPDVPMPTEFAIAIPESFASSYVQKVMYGGKQIAEIDLEYIKSVNKQVTVVYPCGEDGKADLTKGLTTTGASVVWNLTNNTATVGTEGETAAATLYLVDGTVQLAFAGEAAATTVAPDVITDQRGTQIEKYTITKIGTQYWMAENLRARFFTDGTAITAISGDDTTGAWNDNTTGAYLEDNNADWVNVAGLMYNGYCVTATNGIAPEGWEVPTQAQLSKMRSAGNLKSVNFRSTEPSAWNTVYAANNWTGFSAIACGYYTQANGIQFDMTEAWFWSSTEYYDGLAKSNVLDYLRITATSATSNIVVSNNTSGGHSPWIGHNIRCVRK